MLQYVLMFKKNNMRTKTFVVGNKDANQRPLFQDILKNAAHKTVRDFPDLAILSAVITGAVLMFKNGTPTPIDVAQHAGVSVVGATALDFAAHLTNKFRKSSKKSSAPAP